MRIKSALYLPGASQRPHEFEPENQLAADAVVPGEELVEHERLGHANPAFTMTVYQHVIPGMQEEAASLFSDLIFGRDESALAPAP
jgi:hypothetical protein